MQIKSIPTPKRGTQNVIKCEMTQTSKYSLVKYVLGPIIYSLPKRKSAKFPDTP